MDHTTKAATLARLAAENPAALSPSGWQSVKAGAGPWPPASASPGGSDAPNGFDSAMVLSHPSGLIVHGPGASEVIRQARGEIYNSAVYAVLRSKTEAYTEPPLRVWRGPYGDIASSDIMPDHPANAIIQRSASEWVPTLQFRQALRWGLDTWGDYYAVKIRAGGGSVLENVTGPVIGLWGVAGDVMQPTRRKGAAAPITHYLWDIGTAHPVEVPLENVMHWRNGSDPRNPLMGMGPLRLIMREIMTDSEADAFVHFFLKNSGVPGLVFSPAGTIPFAPSTVEGIKESVRARTSGGNRGDVFVLSQPGQVSQYQFDPGAMDLGPVWRHTESRIAAVLGWPAFLAGLQVGQELKYSNASEAREYATETTLMSHWAQDGQVWDKGLRDAFRLRPDEYIAHDWTVVRALQQDMQQKWTREKEQIELGALGLGEWRASQGWGPLPEDDPGLLVGDKANIVSLIKSVGMGEIAPDAARAVLVSAFRLSDAQALAMVPNTAAPKPTPASASGKGLGGDPETKAADKSVKVSEDDIDDAISAWDRWATENAPAYVGMLD